MESSDIFTHDDDETERRKYNMPDVNTVFHLEEDVEEIPEIDLTGGTVVLPSLDDGDHHQVIDDGDHRVSLDDDHHQVLVDGDHHQVIQITDNNSAEVLHVTVHNNQVVPIQLDHVGSDHLPIVQDSNHLPLYTVPASNIVVQTVQQSPSHQNVLQETGFEESHSESSVNLPYHYVRFQSPSIQVTRSPSIYSQTGHSLRDNVHRENLGIPAAPSRGVQLTKNSNMVIERLALANQTNSKTNFRNNRIIQSFKSQEDLDVCIKTEGPNIHSPLIQHTEESMTVKELDEGFKTEELEEDCRTEELEHAHITEELEQISRTEEKMYLEDFVEIYTIFKCRKCLFTCASKDDLYEHVKLKHLDLLKWDQKLDVKSNLVLADQRDKYDMRSSSDTTVILDDKHQIDQQSDRTENLGDRIPTASNGPSYFQFFLVKEQKQVFICTTCSICVSNEDKIKMHVKVRNCVEHKCTNCGVRLSTKAEYKEHTSKCKVAIFKVKEISKEDANNISMSEDDTEHIIQQEYVNGDCLVTSQISKAVISDSESDLEATDQLQDLEDDDSRLSQEEYKFHRLKRNRTNLEVDCDTRVWVCSVKNCYATFKNEEILEFHLSCHQFPVNSSNPQLDSSNPQLDSSNPQLDSSNPQLDSSNPQLDSSNPQLDSSNPQLDSSNPQQHQILLSCPFCVAEYSRWRYLSHHLYTKHNKDCDLYECGQCRQYKASCVSILEKHYLTHDNLKTFQCNVCQKGFNQRNQLRNHVVLHLKKHGSQVPNWAKAKKCDICHKVLADSKILKKHVQAVHSKLKPYICKICGYKCSRNSNLKLHVRQHSGDKPYECSACHYKTGDKSALRRHIRKHTNDRPYKCEHCNFTSIQSGNLKKHIISKHIEAPPELHTPRGQRGKKKVITLKPGSKQNLEEDYSMPVHILQDKPKDEPSIHTLDSLLALAEHN